MKKQTAKLVLKKETITNLENSQMNVLKGGAPVTYYCTKPTVCPTVDTKCKNCTALCE